MTELNKNKWEEILLNLPFICVVITCSLIIISETVREDSINFEYFICNNLCTTCGS